MAYALAVLAALVVAGGEVLQQRLAAQAPPQDEFSLRLLWWLVRRPRWLAGVAGSFAGNAVFSAAVGAGSVILVEAVFTVRLVFGLVIAALWGMHRVPLRDVGGAAVITTGLVSFLLAVRPREGPAETTDLRWAVGAGSIAALTLLATLLARRLSGSGRVVLLGLGAGTLFGLQASLMQRSVRLLSSSGVGALLSSWSGYAVVAVALAGMLLVQTAFNAAPLAASYPAVVTAQLLCSLAIGVFVLRTAVSTAPERLAAGAAALAAMLLGIWLLTRSPLITGQLHGHRGSAPDARPEGGHLARPPRPAAGATRQRWDPDR